MEQKSTQECRVVANYIIEMINKHNEGKLYSERIFMTVKRLQKLLYFCDVNHMKEYNGLPMFNDLFCAWPSGPVIPSIYDEYLQYQNGVIKPIYDDLVISITSQKAYIVDKVLEDTKDIDTFDLVKICRVDNGPWDQVFDANDKEHNQIISKEEMYNYYRENKKKIRKR